MLKLGITASIVTLLACSAAAQGERPNLADPAPQNSQDYRAETPDLAVSNLPSQRKPGESPRSTVSEFLSAARDGDYSRAAEFLDTSSTTLSADVLARQLQTVLDKTLWIDLGALSDDPEGDLGDALHANRERVARVPIGDSEASIWLEQIRTEAGREWRISSATVAQIPQLYEVHGHGKLGELLPQVFFDLRLLNVELWQWIGLLVLVLVAGIVAWAFAGLAAALLRSVLRTRTEMDESLVAVITGPMRLGIGVATFAVAKNPLGLSLGVQAVLGALESTLFIFAVTWGAMRVLDVFSALVEVQLRERNQTSAITVLPSGRKTLKTFLVGIAVIAVLDSFGFDVTALIAGLGVGGIAVALAAQKTVENLFGGATLYADSPVRVGDFCRFGEKIGTVEEIGMRSTRVRTLDRTVVAIPNGEFANLQLENFARRDKIWFHPRIGLRYETSPDQLRCILVEIRRMLYAHPKVDPDPARIRFVGFGAYSLDLDIFAYVKVTDYGEFLEVAEDLNLRIMDIIGEAGSGFAFPSQTTYLEHGEGLDEERSRSAEAAVKTWREERALYLPRFPEEQIEALRNTLDYPSEGSPSAGDGSPL